MPSSISSSSERIPNLPLGKMWILIIIFTSIVCSGAEISWRVLGHRPSIVDGPAWWAVQRGAIYADASKTVVLAGASRMNLDFSTVVFHNRFPDHNIFDLAYGGHQPLETLRDLANDKNFGGIVLCSALPCGAVGSDDMSEYLDAYYHSSSFDRKMNRIIASKLQQTFTFINPQVQTAKVIRSILHGTLPRPLYVICHYDRTRSADYTMSDIVEQRQMRINKVLNDPRRFTVANHAEWLKRVNEVEGYVKQIQDRGGNVVFIVFPTTGVSWSVPEEQNPKTEYWDKFAKMTKGVPIHFLDYPALRGFDCPDTSHLDYRDSIPFTNGLLDILEQQGVFENKENH